MTKVVVDKTKPDVLRVTEYILKQAKAGNTFSVQSASLSTELNGINRYRLAQIMRDICIEPNGEGSLIQYTQVDSTNIDNSFFNWQLNANAYFSYLSHLSLIRSEQSNKIAVNSLRIAAASFLIAIITISLEIVPKII